MSPGPQRPLDKFVQHPHEQDTIDTLRDFGYYLRPLPQGKGSGDVSDLQHGHDARRFMYELDPRDPQAHEKSKQVILESSRIDTPYSVLVSPGMER